MLPYMNTEVGRNVAFVSCIVIVLIIIPCSVGNVAHAAAGRAGGLCHSDR